VEKHSSADAWKLLSHADMSSANTYGDDVNFGSSNSNSEEGSSSESSSEKFLLFIKHEEGRFFFLQIRIFAFMQKKKERLK
jgi:hypothetical protein